MWHDLLTKEGDRDRHKPRRNFFAPCTQQILGWPVVAIEYCGSLGRACKDQAQPMMNESGGELEIITTLEASPPSLKAFKKQDLI